MPLVISIELPRQDDVIRLLAMSNAYAQSLYPSESNHLLDLEEMEKPGVTFWVGRLDGDAVGCCALVEADGGTAEIKRMFVDANARGHGVARLLMNALEETAEKKKLSALRLETGIYQPEAIGLYRKFGFVEIAAFGSYQPDPLSMFMEKRFPRT